MAYKKIFIDSDVLLDFFLDRYPFADHADALLRMKQTVEKRYTSTLVIANIHYLLRKLINGKEALNAIEQLMEDLKILSFEETHLNLAITAQHIDFEDSIQYYIAKQNDCDLIISRNIKHYKKFDIPVLTAEQFLRTIL
jgi:predicted nucleic acid-binding protein